MNINNFDFAELQRQFPQIQQIIPPQFQNLHTGLQQVGNLQIFADLLDRFPKGISYFRLARRVASGRNDTQDLANELVACIENPDNMQTGQRFVRALGDFMHDANNAPPQSFNQHDRRTLEFFKHMSTLNSSTKEGLLEHMRAFQLQDVPAPPVFPDDFLATLANFDSMKFTGNLVEPIAINRHYDVGHFLDKFLDHLSVLQDCATLQNTQNLLNMLTSLSSEKPVVINFKSLDSMLMRSLGASSLVDSLRCRVVVPIADMNNRATQLHQYLNCNNHSFSTKSMKKPNWIDYKFTVAIPMTIKGDKIMVPFEIKDNTITVPFEIQIVPEILHNHDDHSCYECTRCQHNHGTLVETTEDTDGPPEAWTLACRIWKCSYAHILVR
jgi:hypothetical protein